jgi:hypothetical protein
MLTPNPVNSHFPSPLPRQHIHNNLMPNEPDPATPVNRLDRMADISAVPAGQSSVRGELMI